MAAAPGIMITIVDGSLYVSHDGAVWTLTRGSSGGAIHDVAWAGDHFVAVGDSMILASPNGEAWAQVAAPAARLVGVAWGGGRIVAVGRALDYSSVAVVSVDGLHWNTVADAFGGNDVAVDVAWTGDRFVAVGTSVFASADGTTWVPHPAPALGRDLRAVASNGSRIVIVGPSVVASSPDLSEWAVSSAGNHLNLASVASNGVRFVAVAGLTALVSDDGLNWNSASLPAPGGTAVTWSGERFVVVGGCILASSDGAAWTTLAQPGPDLRSIAYGAGRYVAVGTDRQGGQAVVLASSGGTDWAGVADAPDQPLADLAWRGSDFVAVGVAGGVWRSDDGLNWSVVAPPGSGSNTYASIAAHGNTLVVAGRTPTGGAIFSSLDGGATWQYALADGALTLHDVAWANGEFVAVGTRKVCNPYETNAAAVLYTSPDGTIWTRRAESLAACSDPASTDSLGGVATGGGRVVAVGVVNGVRGHALYGLDSADGVSWRARTWLPGDAPVGDGLAAVAWAGTRFVAVGQGLVAISSTGAYWDSWRADDPTASLVAAAAGDAGTIAVGPGGLVFNAATLGDASCRTALSFTTPGVNRRVLPAVAHVAGAAGTLWTSDLSLQSTGGQSSVTLALLPRDRSNATVLAVTTVVPGQAYSLAIPDVVSARFGADSSAGALVIESAQPLLVSSRTWTPGPHGSYGQYVPALDPSSASTNTRLIHLTSDAAFRTNVGFVSVNSEPTAVSIVFYRADGGGPITTSTVNLPAFGVHQVTDALAAASTVDDAYAVVTAGRPVLCYGSVVDRRTGDPTLVLPAVATSQPVVLAGAAHTAGYGGTLWRTDLEVHNPGPGDAAYRIELLRERQDNSVPSSVSFALAAGRSARYPDVLAGLFGASGAAALRVTPTTGAVAASARTYTAAPEGTYGQLVPALTGSAAGASLRLIQLAQSADPTTGFRTNLGLVNVTGGTVSVTIELHRGDGALLGSRILSLQPYEYRQENGVIASVTSADIPDAYAIITATTPGGAVLAYASVVDNRSGDPIYVPAR